MYYYPEIALTVLKLLNRVEPITQTRPEEKRKTEKGENGEKGEKGKK